MSESKLNISNVIEITNNTSLEEREPTYVYSPTDYTLTMTSLNTGNVIGLELVKRLGGIEKTKGIHISISNERYGYHGRESQLFTFTASLPNNQKVVLKTTLYTHDKDEDTIIYYDSKDDIHKFVTAIVDIVNSQEGQ